MEKFLKKYLTEEQIKPIRDAYIADHPDAKTLPEYISKTRLDEVLAKQHASEESVTNLTKELDTLKTGTQAAVDEAVKKAKEEDTAHENEVVNSLKKDHEIDTAILSAHGKNLKAIKALIDATKDVSSEITRLKKSDAYLFGEELPGGTGKDGNGDGKGKASEELARMRRAVGITSPDAN